ncbi:lantibiotic immunity ABC transporter MutG family permease subunit [Streptococcus anginosus]|uniref:lantibiotic immunity ABC transporter MutG family permease subunit n=1 Tax=Streptococcus anginosus TaxID=1328 RepID=UPI00221F69B8|nr:lantibiotic immunity ABC transporter MutG family permease subunit [Streptococcus anginosus]MCW1087313.1 lantibiotic immunity ABC transporter MutG family permease subunit [Streptococcus anginosus]
MINILKSEFYKLKHTWIPWAHFILPILYAILFYGAATITGLKNFSDMDIIQNYFVLLGAVLPIICGVITSKIVDMEVSAGRFQVLLSTTKSRSKAYGGKLLLLLFSFLFSTSLAVLIFAMLFGNQENIAWLIELLLVVIGCLSTYMIHLWVSIMLGSGASIGLGFVGTLIALLSITNLGENIWYFFPCTWPSRLSATYIVGSKLANSSYLIKELTTWVYVALPITVAIFIGSLLWFNRWDGKSISE